MLSRANERNVLCVIHKEVGRPLGGVYKIVEITVALAWPQWPATKLCE